MNIAIIMMQKNEVELVDKWVKFHGELFGYDNLYVFDNGSTDEIAIKHLKESESLGVNVDWKYSKAEHFEAKGDIIGSKIKELDAFGAYDFYMPLDCDEFIGVSDECNEISFSIEKINNELMKFINNEDILLIKGHYYNSPISNRHFAFTENRKCFFHKGTFKSLDIGFHRGKNLNSDKEIRTNIVQVHFHNKPFLEVKKYATQKLSQRVNINDLRALTSFLGRGSHLKNYFYMNEFKYIRQIIRKEHMLIDAVLRQFQSCSIKWPYEKSLTSQNISFIGLDGLNSYKLNIAHETVTGNIEALSINDTTLNISGWSFDESNKRVNNYTLVINDSIFVHIDNVVSTVRKDVQKAYKCESADFGFSLSVNICDLIHKNVYVNNISVFSGNVANNIGSELKLKKIKRNNFLKEVNDYDYRDIYSYTN